MALSGAVVEGMCWHCSLTDWRASMVGWTNIVDVDVFVECRRQ
jgi:hypothetical protein